MPWLDTTSITKFPMWEMMRGILNFSIKIHHQNLTRVIFVTFLWHMCDMSRDVFWWLWINLIKINFCDMSVTGHFWACHRGVTGLSQRCHCFFQLDAKPQENNIWHVTHMSMKCHQSVTKLHQAPPNGNSTSWGYFLWHFGDKSLTHVWHV